MKRLALLPAFLSAALFICPAALAQDEKAKEDKPEKKKKTDKKQKTKLRGEYGIMASVLKLDEETCAKIQAQCEANAKALKEADAAGKAKLKELRAALAKAKKAKEEDKVADLQKQIKEAEQAKAKQQAENMAKIMALLTDEQKAVWKAFDLNRVMMREFKAAKLTKEQTASVKKLCDEAAAGIPFASECTDAEKKQARADGLKKLAEKVTSDVLTEEQRAKLTKGAKEGKAKGKAKAGGKAKAKKEAKPAEGDKEEGAE